MKIEKVKKVVKAYLILGLIIGFIFGVTATIVTPKAYHAFVRWYTLNDHYGHWEDFGTNGHPQMIFVYDCMGHCDQSHPEWEE